MNIDPYVLELLKSNVSRIEKELGIAKEKLADYMGVYPTETISLVFPEGRAPAALRKKRRSTDIKWSDVVQKAFNDLDSPCFTAKLYEHIADNNASVKQLMESDRHRCISRLSGTVSSLTKRKRLRYITNDLKQRLYGLSKWFKADGSLKIEVLKKLEIENEVDLDSFGINFKNGQLILDTLK